jgi:hypothetical protein
MSYPSALDALHRQVSPDGLICSPTGYVLASPAALPPVLRTVGPSSLDRLGLASGRQPPGLADGLPDEVAAGLFADGLLGLHRDLLLHGIDHAMRHLEGRTSSGATLLSMQLIQSQLADIALQLRMDMAVSAIGRTADPAARWRSYQRLVTAGRALLRLLGASGFLADGPAGELYLAEFAGNVYLQLEGDCPDD